MIRSFEHIGLLLTVLLVTSTAARAQRREPSVPKGRIAVVIVLLPRRDTANADLAERVEADQRTQLGRDEGRVALHEGTVVLRRTGSVNPNLIVMSEASASAGRLAAAATTLAALIQRDGDVSTRRSLYRIPANQPAPPIEVRSASKILDRLRRSPATTFEGLVGVRTTQVFLPGRLLQDSLRRRGVLNIYRSP